MPRFPFLLLLSALSMPGAAAEPETALQASAGKMVFPVSRPAPSGALRVLSLNMAHGRKDALNQLLLGSEDIKRNLTDIAALLLNIRADVVALQEADGPSRWSGGFDHVALLAGQAGYPFYSRASHARSWLFDYGTALLSRVELKEAVSHTFQPTPPSLTKGMSLGQIAWRPDTGADTVLIDVVSVHLDFSRDSVRSRQIAEIAEFMSDRSHPLIVVGDFNSDWLSAGSVVAELARRCRMQAYQPMADNMATYRSSGRRLDWMLISDDLEFLSHAVLPEVVSDHQAVVADVRLKPSGDARADDARQGAPRCAP